MRPCVTCHCDVSARLNSQSVFGEIIFPIVGDWVYCLDVPLAQFLSGSYVLTLLFNFCFKAFFLFSLLFFLVPLIIRRTIWYLIRVFPSLNPLLYFSTESLPKTLIYHFWSINWMSNATLYIERISSLSFEPVHKWNIYVYTYTLVDRLRAIYHWRSCLLRIYLI